MDSAPPPYLHPCRLRAPISVPTGEVDRDARRQVSAQPRETQVQTAPGGISESELPVLRRKQVCQWLSTRVIWEYFASTPVS